ncbi:hypothetical protein D3C80_2061490 [compost metagenome]
MIAIRPAYMVMPMMRMPVMGVVMITGLIGFRLEPALHVRRFRFRIIETAFKKRRITRALFTSFQNVCAGIERMKTRLQCRQS